MKLSKLEVLVETLYQCKTWAQESMDYEISDLTDIEVFWENQDGTGFSEHVNMFDKVDELIEEVEKLSPPIEPEGNSEVVGAGKMLLMNGPLKCGKDVALDYLKDNYFPQMVRREAKDKLHELTISFFNVTEEFYWTTYNDRSVKEAPLPEFSIKTGMLQKLGEIIPEVLDRGQKSEYTELSIREAMIFVSEVICKPVFGKDYFGVCRADNIDKGELSFDGSCGFQEELPPLIGKLGQDNIMLLRIHRPGYEFGDNDSRSYMPDGVIENTLDICNDGTEQEYYEEILKKVAPFIEGSTL
jgi:hypothetical protein